MSGKNQLSDEFLRQIAEEYRTHVMTPGKIKTNTRIAEAHNVSVSTASNWVKSARRRGILEEHRLRPCSQCGSALDMLPPIVSQHHMASIERMLENAVRLQKRCHKLAKEAHEQQMFRLSGALLAAATNYGLTIKSLQNADKHLKSLYQPQRLGVAATKPDKRKPATKRRREARERELQEQAVDAEIAELIALQLESL